MGKRRKEHIAKPMESYEKTPKIRCIDNPGTKYECMAAKERSRYHSVSEIEQEFELRRRFDINDDRPTF